MVASTATLVVFAVVAVPAVVLVVYMSIQGAIVRIDTGELGLVVRRGRPTDRTLLPGTHLVPPFGRMIVQTYPSRELSYRTTRDAGSEDDANPAVDPPIGVALGDRSHADVCYTIRFRLDPERLAEVHTRFGPDGLYGVVRDVSEQEVADGLARATVTYEHLFGQQRTELQADLHERVRTALASHGFVVTFFGLREIDLGEIGEALQAKARAAALSEQYQIAAAARRARAEHDVEIAAMLGDLPDSALRYQQIEAWRSLVERWDGRIGMPAVVSQRALAEPTPDGGAS